MVMPENKAIEQVKTVKAVEDALEVSPSAKQASSPVYGGGSKASADGGVESSLKKPAKGKPKHSGSGNKY